MGLPRRPARIHHHHAPLLPRRNRQIPFTHSPKKRPRLLLKSILIPMPAPRAYRIPLIPPPRPAHTRPRVRIKQDRQVGLQVPAQHPMQLPHRLAPQPPPAALIRLSRIRKSIAQHNTPRRQRRLNHFGNMLRPRSKHQSHLRQWRKPGRTGIEQHLPNLLPRQRPARLPRLHDLVTGRVQHRGQLPHLRALARPVEPFKRNELPAPQHLRNHSSVLLAGSPSPGYNCVHMRTHDKPTGTLEVGIREFREKLATYLLETDQTVAVTRHGDVVGYYIPARRKRTQAERDALEEVASRLQEEMTKAGVSEDDIVRDFKSWRRTQHK